MLHDFRYSLVPANWERIRHLHLAWESRSYLNVHNRRHHGCVRRAEYHRYSIGEEEWIDVCETLTTLTGLVSLKVVLRTLCGWGPDINGLRGLERVTQPRDFEVWVPFPKTVMERVIQARGLPFTIRREVEGPEPTPHLVIIGDQSFPGTIGLP